MYELIMKFRNGKEFRYRFSPYISSDDAMEICKYKYEIGDCNGEKVRSVTLNKNNKKVGVYDGNWHF